MSGDKGFFSRSFGRLPLRYKLTAIILGITFIALLSSLVIGSISGYLALRAEKQGQLGVMADFTAKNIASSLDFQDQKSAEENLRALAFDPSIHRACVYDADGALFASYVLGGEASACPSTYDEATLKNTVDRLYAHLPVRPGRDVIGNVSLLYDLQGAHAKFFWQTMMSLVIMMMTLLIAYILANIVQRVISRPVTELASAAHKFAGREDFSIRVEKTTDDELGYMVDAFNRMVEKMKERDEIIVRTREDAIAANKMKSEFLANMSHELRTPLNSILGMTRILIESDSLIQDHRDMATTVCKSAANLLDIVNDILDISKIEAGSIVLEKIGFDLRETIAGLVEVMAPLASAKGISLSHHFHTDDIPYIVGDPLRVSRILMNLVSNAIKYTTKGSVGVTIAASGAAAEPLSMGNHNGVKIDIAPRALPDGTIEIYCAVADTGIGIAPDKLEMIFEKFSQADASTTRKYGGTGLGLAITKELVELMGGSIGVDSEVGKGSVFWFRIPFGVTDKLDEDIQGKRRKKRDGDKSRNDGARVKARNARLLLVEDHLLNQDFMKKLLPRLGISRFDIADNGKIAITSCLKREYDLVLMDCHMPEKNGYEATMDIRQNEKETGRRIPIVAMTADAMKGTQEKCLQAGMDDYISKPVDSDELKDVLAQWLDFEGGADETPQADARAKEAPAAAPACVDLTQLRKFMETPEEIAEFVGVFLSQSQDILDLLSQNRTDGENHAWSEAAHKMKGGAGMAGAQKLAALCAQAQQMETATSAERTALLQSILEEYDRVRIHLQAIVAGGA